MSRLRNLSQVFNSSPEIKLSIKEELKIHLHQLDVVTRQTLHNIESQKEVIEKINDLFEKNRQTKEIKGDFINFIEEDVKTYSKNLLEVEVRVDEMKGFDERVVNDALLEYREEEN